MSRFRMARRNSSRWLSLFLDGVILDAIQAISSDDYLTGSIYIDDLDLLGRVGLTLDFEYLDTTGSRLLLDNVRVSGQAAVPGPATLWVMIMGVMMLWRLRRLHTSRVRR